MPILSIPITPVSAPRQVRSDKWKPRPMVVKYRQFKDELRILLKQKPKIPMNVTFILPMPKSWSMKKKKENWGKPHRQTPDLDNMLKALQDAIYENDSHVWKYENVEKIWGDTGSILIEVN